MNIVELKHPPLMVEFTRLGGPAIIPWCRTLADMLGIYADYPEYFRVVNLALAVFRNPNLLICNGNSNRDGLKESGFAPV
jgi:hypothetical protein